MTLKHPIKVPVFFNTPDSSKMSDLGIETGVKSDHIEIRTVTIYDLCATVPHHEDGEPTGYTVICIPGDEFIVKMPPTEVERIINENL